MFGIKVEVQFCAGHRLMQHKGKCNYYHGHNYVATIEIYSDFLNEDYMVQDFAKIKDPIKLWIDTYWDHNMILNPFDPLLTYNPTLQASRQFFTMPTDYPEPTAENMAVVLHRQFRYLIKDNSYQVSIQETPSCSAFYHEV